MKTGDYFQATIENVEIVIGQIVIYKNDIFLCQDLKEGHRPDADMLGYKCSWHVGQATPKELKMANVSNFVILDCSFKEGELVKMENEEMKILAIDNFFAIVGENPDIEVPKSYMPVGKLIKNAKKVDTKTRKESAVWA